MFEISRRELVDEQEVGGRIVRRARQRLGERHEGEALARGQLELMQEILDADDARRAGADRAQEFHGQRRFLGAQMVTHGKVSHARAKSSSGGE